jgi:hypothetical protein
MAIMKKAKLRVTALVGCLAAYATPQTGLSAAPPGRYTVSSDTVYDVKTRLTWQRKIVATPRTFTDANQ